MSRSLSSGAHSRDPLAHAATQDDGPLPDRDPAADGAIEHLRGPLDALGGGIERVRDRGLGLTRAVDGGDADVAEVGELLLEIADARIGIEQLVAGRKRRHHGEALVADLAEFAAELLDARFKTLGELEETHLLSLLAGHAVLPAIDGDIDVAHSSSSSSSPSMSSASASTRPAWWS